MQFLNDHGFQLETLNAEVILNNMLEQMAEGRAGHGPIPMLPASFLMPEKLPQNCECPAFDVGGTNVRSARVRFDSNGDATVLHQVRGPMPGSTSTVTYAEFYQQLCAVLLPNLQPHESLGYCFSYAVDLDNRLLFWTKCIQAPEIVMTDVSKDLSDAIAARGIPGCKAYVLNDTVATLLAAYTHIPLDEEKNAAGFVGFILGTGVNAAYTERTELITKLPTLKPNSFIPINCETGNFDNFPHSDFDNAYEARVGKAHSHWEMCFSGTHLGGLGTEILHTAAREGLFSSSLASTLLAYRYTNIELDKFCAGKTIETLPCTTEERTLLVELIKPIYLRAALFAAINIAAAGICSARARGRTSGEILINADGSTFWKTACIPFRECVENHLAHLLAPRNYSFRIIHMEDAPLIGAAIAVC